MKAVEQLLRARIGLDAGTLGPSVVERTVRLRMKALHLQRPKEYLALLLRSAAEWNELVESVVVVETWFYRDRQPFAVMAQLVREAWSPTQTTRPLRLLSVPCSTGEEPYSMAMALLDAGLPAAAFEIHAVDLSARGLSAARRAVYRRNAFRGGDLGFRERHFKRVEGGFALSPAVRALVRFSQGNVLEESFLEDAAPYDCVFCRNLLIYFDRAAQARALRQLERLLTPQGILFVGAAELPLALNNGFVSAEFPMAFACWKARPTTGSRATPARPRPPPAAASASAALSPAIPAKQPRTRSAPAAARRDDAPAETAVAFARQLANAGRLREATELCQRHLQTCGASAEAYFLLGLMADAQGLAGAFEYYRRAVYLDPNHHEALVQMSLLCARRGDSARARVFSRRAERTQRRP